MQVLRQSGSRRHWWEHRWWCGNNGRQPLTDLLQPLPDDYYLVNDLSMKGSGNIDHVVVGPCGLVVIEAKPWAGNIRCDRDRWSVNGWPRPSVSRHVNRGAAALRRWLADLHPDIYSFGAFIQPLAVFTHPGCRLEINHAGATVVRYSELLHVLHEKAEERRMPAGVAGRLAGSLAGIHASSLRDGNGQGGDES